jgi:hypothetical protein
MLFAEQPVIGKRLAQLGAKERLGIAVQGGDRRILLFALELHHERGSERFEPEAPERGKGPPALRHWGRPLLMGAPDAVERLTARMAWHPWNKLPRALRKLVGALG